MKKILWIAFLLMSVKGFAQISLEHTYQAETYPVEIRPNYWNYYNVSGNTLFIYSLNHSLITSVALTIPSGFNFSGISLLAKGLFTTDTGKYAVEYYSFRSSPFEFITDIVTQDGTNLLEVDSSDGGSAISTSEGAKLILYIESTPIRSLIYSLPGTYSAGIAHPQGDGSGVNNAYPNPTTEAIHLPYTLNGNEQGELDVVNMNGQLLRHYTVTNAFSDILLNVNELPKGTYLYYLTVKGIRTAAKQFVVQ